MAVSQDKVRTLITLTKENKEKLELLAKEDGRSLSSYISNVLQTHIEGEEVIKSLNKLDEKPTLYTDLDKEACMKSMIEAMIGQVLEDKFEKYIKDNIEIKTSPKDKQK